MFIKVVDVNNTEMYVNASLIRAIVYDGSATRLTIDYIPSPEGVRDVSIRVLQTPEEIITLTRNQLLGPINITM